MAKLKGVHWVPPSGLLPCGHGAYDLGPNGEKLCFQCTQPELYEGEDLSMPGPRYHRLYEVVSIRTAPYAYTHVSGSFGPKRSVDRHVRWLWRSYAKRDPGFQVLVFPVAQ